MNYYYGCCCWCCSCIIGVVYQVICPWTERNISLNIYNAKQCELLKKDGILDFIPIFSMSNSKFTTGTPMITETIMAWISYILVNSMQKPVYFLSLSFYLTMILWLRRSVTSIRRPFLASLPTTLTSSLVASRTRSIGMIKSHRLVNWSFSINFPGL